MNSKLKRIMTEHPRPSTGLAGAGRALDVDLESLELRDGLRYGPATSRPAPLTVRAIAALWAVRFMLSTDLGDRLRARGREGPRDQLRDLAEQIGLLIRCTVRGVKARSVGASGRACRICWASWATPASKCSSSVMEVQSCKNRQGN